MLPQPRLLYHLQMHLHAVSDKVFSLYVSCGRSFVTTMRNIIINGTVYQARTVKNSLIKEKIDNGKILRSGFKMYNYLCP